MGKNKTEEHMLLLHHFREVDFIQFESPFLMRNFLNNVEVFIAEDRR